jgi:histidyl-tRNA synthetase
MQLEPPRGMRDFYPADLDLRDRIFAAWTDASTLHGFQRFEPPVVESFELLARKAGEEVAQQIYHFEDKSNRQLALRPEVTPSLVRMISARAQDIVFPAKWWTIGQCFRYERMTRGRKREHFQWNLDVVGEPSVQAEAWILATVTSALGALGLGARDVRIHINNRQVVAYLLGELGVPRESHVDVFMVLDKKGKAPVETLKEMLVEKGLAAKTADEVMDLLGGEAADSLSSGPLAASPAAEDVRRLLDLADAMGFADYLRFDSGVVRGLAYYTGTVFEGFDAERKFRAIFGGGRYDNSVRRHDRHGASGGGDGLRRRGHRRDPDRIEGADARQAEGRGVRGDVRCGSGPGRRAHCRRTGGGRHPDRPGFFRRQAGEVLRLCGPARRAIHGVSGAE